MINDKNIPMTLYDNLKTTGKESHGIKKDEKSLLN